MATVNLELPENEVIELVRQLSPQAKRRVLQALIPDMDKLDILMEYGSTRMHALCAERGIDWDSLGKEEREHLVDTWLHEG